MTSFPGSPKLVKGGLVLLDPESGSLRGVVVLQYNPDAITRTLQVQAVGADGADRSEALRLKAPPVETISLEAVLDAVDQLEDADPAAVEVGIQPHLAALETIVYPPARQLLANDQLARSGTLEIAPVQAPLSLLVWSRDRVVPVRLTEFSAREEAFAPSLVPIRATVTLGLRVLSVDDLGFAHRGGGLYLAYQQRKEQLGAAGLGRDVAPIGVRGLS